MGLVQRVRANVARAVGFTPSGPRAPPTRMLAATRAPSSAVSASTAGAAGDQIWVDQFHIRRVGLSMVDPVNKHVEELLKLPLDERSEAAEVLLRSLEQEPEENEAVIAAAWVAEVERRIGENEPGIPAETVFAEGRARLQKLS
jgi:hypothetical protein